MERRLELEQIHQHRDELRSMLEDQATKAEQWYTKAKDLEQQIEQSQSVAAIDPKAITLLQEALLLKANAGGAIKREIEKVLVLLLTKH